MTRKTKYAAALALIFVCGLVLRAPNKRSSSNPTPDKAPKPAVKERSVATSPRPGRHDARQRLNPHAAIAPGSPRKHNSPTVYGWTMTQDRGDFLAAMRIWTCSPPDVFPPANGVSYSDREVLQAYPFLLAEDGSAKTEFLYPLRLNLQQEWNLMNKLRDGSAPGGMDVNDPALGTLAKLRRERFGLFWNARGNAPVDTTRVTPEPSPRFLELAPESPKLSQPRFRHLIRAVAGVQSCNEISPARERGISSIKRTFASSKITLSNEQAAELLDSPLQDLVVNALASR